METRAYGINNSGDVVGAYIDGGHFGFVGFVYSGGACTPIVVPGALDTSAFGVNDAGQIVGIWSTGDDRTHGFILSAGAYTTFDLGTYSTIPIGINNNGDIVGWYADALPEGGTLPRG